MKNNRLAFGAGVILFAILAVIIMSPVCHAQNTRPGLGDFAYGLDANIVIDDSPLHNSPARINASVQIRNQNEKNDYIVYLISNKNGTWITERLLGVVPAGSSSKFDFEFAAKYSGESHAKSQYAIVASGDDVLLGKYFDVEENWKEYETEQSMKIYAVAQYAVPIAAVLVILIIAGLTKWAYDNKSSRQFSREYTVWSFFVPHIKGKPFKEILADVLINPVFWAFELILLALALQAIWSETRIHGGLDAIAITFFAGILIPLIYFLLVWIYNSLVEKMPLRFLVGAFVWGITAAVISLILNSAQARFLWQGMGIEHATVVLLTTAIVAPAIEEIAKGIGLLGMWGHHEFSDTLHGLHLGLAVGLGFSFVENWLYFSAKVQPLEMGVYAWLSIVIYRSFFNSIAHACFSAALGASLGWAKSHGWGAIATISFIPGLLTAIVLHSIFNITAIIDGFEALSANFPVFRYNPAMIVVLLVILAVVMIGATLERRRVRVRRAGRIRRAY